MGTFFPHFPSQTFAPFFREFDSLFPAESLIPRSQHFRPSTPRFDVKEVAAAYELHGELPGIKQEDINIEFVDANTLVIKGKTERASARSNDVDVKGKAVEDGASSPKTIAADNASETSSSYHKATVEDDYVDAGAEQEASSAAVPTAKPSASSDNQAVAPTTIEEQPQHKYWVSERSVGEFQRTFSFPGKVDQEAVKASLKNGILSVIVPKAAKQERKITIE
ncbi:MAG: hypothetical protein LQ352_000311 [Teloschistes flavicans]|nr:MAG: hypothetical protein LQ352_000311 [Teloschistes flavicans]